LTDWFEYPARLACHADPASKGAVMKAIRVLSVVGVLCLCSSAQAASVISVSNDGGRTFTTETSRGTATTEIARSGNNITATTKFTPKGSYQPMGSGGSSYQPMGGSGGYKPMGR
jgi:hypothetical protein